MLPSLPSFKIKILSSLVNDEENNSHVIVEQTNNNTKIQSSQFQYQQTNHNTPIIADINGIDPYSLASDVLS